MAKKVSENNIQDITQDWGLDTSNNLPYSGAAVQKFIKETFNSKMGYFYYDPSSNRYLCFADEASKDKYVADPTLAELVLGTFDAPFTYQASIKLLTPSYVPILIGTTGNYISFTFDIKNKEGASVGDSISAVWTFKRGSNEQTVRAKYAYGQSVTMNVDKYLGEGTNTIIIRITGDNTLAQSSVAITYQVMNISLKSDYDISKMYDLRSGASRIAEVPFTVSGYGTKTVEWFLDGEKLAFEQSIDEVTQNTASRNKLITMSNLSQGKHSLQLRAYSEMDGQPFYSNLLYKDLIVYTGTGEEPIIALSAVLPFDSELVSGNLALSGATQFVPYKIDFAVYNPMGAAVDVTIKVDGVTVAVVAAESGAVNTFTYTPNTYGTKTVTFTAGETVYTLSLDVEKNDNAIEEIVDSLELDLQASGKTNASVDKDQWSYGNYSTEFTGFQWNELSGWNDDALFIPEGASIEVDFAPLKADATNTGKTLEFEFATTGVASDDAVVCDLRDASGTGILITASEVTLFSSGGKQLGRPFKSGENIRVAFVINKDSGVTNKGMAFIYINGIVSGSIDFSATDNFISSRNIIFSGSADASVMLRSIRVYSKALSHDEVLNNYMLYRKSVDEMMEVYDRNNIYEEGSERFSMDKLANQLPVMIITGDIPSLEATTDKNKSIVVDVEYINYQNPEYSFTMKNAHMQPQGTSSMGYPKKNFRLYTQKRDDTKVYDADGQEIESKLYSFTQNAAPVNCWCMKADYAESSSTHNTAIARLWNDVMKNVKLDDEYVCRTQAQKAAMDNGYEYDVRTTIDGFPIVMAYRLTPTSDLVFIGKYNFNNDKETEQVFGFRDIPGFDNSHMQCWEVLNNGNHLALFQDTKNFDKEWSEAFESRYPDTKTPNTADLKAFATWLTTTTNFATEKWQHLDVYKMAAYYVYVMRFGAVDQMVKNAMFTSEDGQKFYYINYDNDTINGLRNDGYLMYPPTITRQSLDESYDTEVYAYAGHDSRLWNNLEADAEFMGIVQRIDSALYNAGLTYANVIKMFDEEQSAKWCERVYNQDAQYKYVSPFVENGTNNLFMMQGSRQSHRRWWLSKRFSFIDAMFVSGEFKSNVIETKLANAPIGLEFSIVAGEGSAYGYGVNDVAVHTGVGLEEGEKYTFTTKQVLNVGDPLRLYSAPNLREVDLSNFTPYMSTLVIGGVNSAELGTKLKKLIIGVDTTIDGRRNTSLSQISGIEMAKRLEEINVEGYSALTSLAVEGLNYLKTLKAYKSGLTGISLADGSPIELLELPATLQGISLSNASRLTQGGLRLEGGWASLSSISIKKCQHFMNDFELIKSWYNTKNTEDSKCSLVMEGINWSNVNGGDLAKIANIAQVGGVVSLKGTIRLSQASNDDLVIIREVFGEHVFNKGSELWITSDAMVVVISDGDTIVEGKSMQYSAIVFSEYESGTLTYDIVGDAGAGVNIDSSTGLLTSVEDGGATVSFVVRAMFSPAGGGAAIVGTKRLTIEKAVYPESSKTVISGNNYPSLERESYTWKTTTAGVNGYMTAEWTLTGDITSYYEIESQDVRECILRKTADISGAVSGTLSLVLKKESDSNQILSISSTLIVKDATVMMTSLSNPEAMSCMYKAGLASNPAYMTYAEAASVTDSQLQSGTSYSTSIFYKYGTNIKTFDEFQYFTGLTTVPNHCFSRCTYLTSIKLPVQIISIGTYAFSNSNSYHAMLSEIEIPSSVGTIKSYAFAYNPLIGVHFNEGLITIEDYAFYCCESLISLHIPSTTTTIGSSFVDTHSLLHISGGEGVVTIADYAFGGVNKEVTIDDTVTFGLFCINGLKTNISGLYGDGRVRAFLLGEKEFKTQSGVYFEGMVSTYTSILEYTGGIEDITDRFHIVGNTLQIFTNKTEANFVVVYTSFDGSEKEVTVSAGTHVLDIEFETSVTITPELFVDEEALAVTFSKGNSDSKTINYKERVYLFIRHTDGTMYTAEEWNGTNEEVDGIAVIGYVSGGAVISLQHDSKKWSSSNVLVPDICTYTYIGNIPERNGYLDTLKIVEYIGIGNAPAAEYCLDYTFPSGKTGYLPSLYEINMMSQKAAEINSLIKSVGGSTYPNRYSYSWTSTQYDSSSAFSYSCGNETFTSTTRSKTGSDYARPFGLYGCVKITANISSTYIVSYTNIQGVKTSRTISNGNIYAFNVLYGTEMTVSPNTSGDSMAEPQTFTFTQDLHELNFVYSKGPGVYIQHVDGGFYTKDEWSSGNYGNSKANGIALLSDSFSSFVVSLNRLSSQKWSSNKVFIDGIRYSANVISDFNGEQSTNEIVRNYPEQQSAAKLCTEYIFPNGKHGYLPAGGELYALYNNKGLIQELMTAVGGADISSGNIWIAAQSGNDSSYAWYINLATGSVQAKSKTSSCDVIPFAKI